MNLRKRTKLNDSSFSKRNKGKTNHTHDPVEMVDSSSLFCSESGEQNEALLALLVERFKRDGYLLLRHFLNREKVLRARACIVSYIHDILGENCPIGLEGFNPYLEKSMKPDSSTPDNSRLTKKRFSLSSTSKSALLHSKNEKTCCHPKSESNSTRGEVCLMDAQHLARTESVLGILEDPNLFSLFSIFFGRAHGVATVSFKWLRAVPPDRHTGVHTDRVFMGSQTPGLLTCWIPLGDIPRRQGTLMVIPGSHTSNNFESIRNGYGKRTVGKDGTESGWLCKDSEEVYSLIQKQHRKKEKVQDNKVSICSLSDHSSSIEEDTFHWATTDFQAGDVVVLSLDILHCSSVNKTSQLRISCDTRWQPVDQSSRFPLSATRREAQR